MRFLLILLFPLISSAQTQISGRIHHQGKPLSLAHIRLYGTNLGTVSDRNGQFILELDQTRLTRLQISLVGYLPIDTVIGDLAMPLNFEMKADQLGLEQVVVSANREQVSQREAVVLVQAIDKKTLNTLQRIDVSGSLNFIPGVRTETNCQNCGFTAVRLNGLPGAYSQILINSRPVYSALAGVYGLEQLPSTMIERIEVVRGGGSALFGGNAIAGTINLITKEAYDNEVEGGIMLRHIGNQSPEWVYQLSTTRVNPSLTAGFTAYSLIRRRTEYDANNDGFSELTRLRNLTKGMQAWWKPDNRRKLLVSGFVIDEYRRGGSNFDREPHQSEVAEQLRHHIIGVMAQYEQLSRDYRTKTSVYVSGQTTDRHSYYGGGGRLLAAGDSLTETDLLAINAYGQSNDLAGVGGVSIQHFFTDEVTLLAGTELIVNDVIDRAPGYNRRIDQRLFTSGNYAQLQYQKRKHTFLFGVRFDALWLNGSYLLQDTTIEQNGSWQLPVPRISWMYRINDHIRSRVSYAQGYRAPQAFDEDLHIETVGGAARMSTFGAELSTERSQNLTVSLDFAENWKSMPLNLVVEGFYTRLQNPFVWSLPEELPNGISVIQKINGPGAAVYGITLEYRMAAGDRWLVQTAMTFQRSRYDNPLVLWETSPTDSRPAVQTNQLLRAPDQYGYLQGSYRFNRNLSLVVMAQYTGTMQVAHVIDPDSEYTALKTTPAFLDLGARINYEFFPIGKLRVQWSLGIDNALNSFQRDFDRGASRDAAYVYGPALPRTLNTALRVNL